ncbi:MAG: RteC domain-containing protein [Flavobacterium sp.]|uniref:RteC domain-containing protein n=1 Tax=Flavobacterium sp. TaxID=239 RepID=UPI003262D1B0
MKLFSETLKTELNNQLKVINHESENKVSCTEQSIKAAIGVLEKLKTHFIKHKFQSKTDEIDFFRNIKPQFAAKLIYFNEIYNIETNKPFDSEKALRKYYKTELGKLAAFFNTNLEFYKYYRTGSTHLDNKYFIRGKYDVKLTLDSFYFQADSRFSTSHDYKVAMILANDMIKIFIEEQLTKLDTPNEILPKEKDTTTNKKWTGSKVALIELIYALHAEGVFNNGTSELKEVANIFEIAFDVDLGQFNRTFLEIRARKSERTKFLNTLKEKLILRMDDADEN